MEVLPFINIKKGKLFLDDKSESIKIHDLIEQLGEQNTIYFLDQDGINKDKPNLCTYQNLASRFDLWVDAGPRTVGDVVDLVMAGATQLTIRNNLIQFKDLLKIKELTENKVYVSIEPQYKDQYLSILPEGAEGAIAISTNNHIETDFQIRDKFRSASHKYELYALEANQNNFTFWEKLNIKGMIVELNQVEKVRERWILNQK